MEHFNPNEIGINNGNYFGLPYTTEESEIVILPVPWDATVSYGKGTSSAPEAIMGASLQVDLFDMGVPQAWKVKIGTLPYPDDLCRINKLTRIWADRVVDSLLSGKEKSELKGLIRHVDSGCKKMNDYVYLSATEFLREGKLVAVLGGEHSVPLGLIKALSEVHQEFGVLHIDAHADLRDAYEGLHYSHASIMYNVLHDVPQVKRLTQVAIRDFCQEEYDLIQKDKRIITFFDSNIKKSLYEGESYSSLCDKIIATLPHKVYVSFDIDGLSVEYCPGTGTPVPGGVSFAEAEYLLRKLVESGREIIGFDLTEVGPRKGDEWDANVGARMLFKLSLLAHLSRGGKNKNF